MSESSLEVQFRDQSLSILILNGATGLKKTKLGCMCNNPITYIE